MKKEGVLPVTELLSFIFLLTFPKNGVAIDGYSYQNYYGPIVEKDFSSNLNDGDYYTQQEYGNVDGNDEVKGFSYSDGDDVSSPAKYEIDFGKFLENIIKSAGIKEPVIGNLPKVYNYNSDYKYGDPYQNENYNEEYNDHSRPENYEEYEDHDHDHHDHHHDHHEHHDHHHDDHHHDHEHLHELPEYYDIYEHEY